MFGFHMVKIGDLSAQMQLPQCAIKHVVSLSDTQAPHVSVVGKAEEMPFAERSVDAFVLAHELDFARDPHQILREVDRCIMPNGHVIIVGFNPFSLAGIAKWMPLKRGSYLHDAGFFSTARVKDWLSLLGFQVIQQHQLLFSDLLLERSINPESQIQKFAEKYLPFLSSVYILIAQKRELPLSLIKPKWRPKPKFAAIGASTRHSA